MGIGPIPRSAIMAYANEQRMFARDQIENFYQIIRLVDNEYISMANTTEKKQPLKGTEVAASDIQGSKEVLTSLRNRAAGTVRKPKRGKS